MGERYDGLINLFQRCATQYNDEQILQMPFDCQDRGWEGITQHLDVFPDGYNDPYIQKILFNFGFDDVAVGEVGRENLVCDKADGVTIVNSHNSVQYSMCYNKNTPEMANFCGPDWVFYHWPTASIVSFASTRDDIIAASAIPPTIPKVGWYGNIYSALKDVPEHTTRPLLKELGDKYNSIFDIVHVQPNYGIIDANIPDGFTDVTPSVSSTSPTATLPKLNYTSLVDLIQYKYLIDIGGNGYSERLKFFLFSKRPILLVDRNYIEYFHSDLQPWVHYVPVQMDLTDLLTQVKWLENNYNEALKIAQNAYNFAMNNFTDEKLNERIYTVYQNINNYRGKSYL